MQHAQEDALAMAALGIPASTPGPRRLSRAGARRPTARVWS